MATAAVLIIGDEILSGKFADENTPYLIGRLRELGVRLRKAVLLPDDPQAIAAELRQAAAEVDLVFTTGGVGPTHDDRTMEAVAEAFGVRLVHHPDLVEVLERATTGGPTEAALRMTRVPEGSRLWWDGELRYPLVVYENVHILPGVPSILRLKFEAAAWRWQGQPEAVARVLTREREVDIAARLEEACRRWLGVDIGSYPRLDETPRHVVVMVEGADAAQVEAARSWLSAALLPLE